MLNGTPQGLSPAVTVIGVLEKVESRDIMPALTKMGWFTLYQGYYFAKPELLKGRKVESNEASKLRVLQLVEKSSSKMALNRGNLLEELANEDKIPSVGADTMFLFGLLSLMEAMLDMPMPELISQLPFSDEIKQGYLDPKSKYNKYLQLLSALEQSSSDQIRSIGKKLKLGELSLADASLRSTVWANEMYQYIL